MARVRMLGVELDVDRPVEALPGDGTKPLITVRRSDAECHLPDRWIGASEWPSIGFVDDAVVFDFPGDVTFRYRAADRSLEYWEHRELDADTFTHELADAAIPRCLAAGGQRVLHGSCVALGDQAVIFLGQSGAGKSTMAAALVSAGWSLVTDDAAVLTEDGASVVPAETNLRLYAESAGAVLRTARLGPPMADWSNKRLVDPSANRLATAAGAVEIAAVMVLEAEAPEPALVPLESAELFELLARNSFDLPMEGPAAGIELLDRWGPVAGRVTGWRLQRPFGFEHFDAVRALIGSVLGERGER